jgi:hypothetical protein
VENIAAIHRFVWGKENWAFGPPTLHLEHGL